MPRHKPHPNDKPQKDKFPAEKSEALASGRSRLRDTTVSATEAAGQGIRISADGKRIVSGARDKAVDVLRA